MGGGASVIPRVQAFSRRLQVGVPSDLLALEANGGHGKVWHRTLRCLASSARVRPLEDGQRRLGRGPRPFDVVLANGHADLPCTKSPLVVQTHEAGWFSDALRQTLDPDFYAYIATRTEAAVRAAERIITPSVSAARDMAEAYGVEMRRFSPVAHGVDPCFRPDAPGGPRIVAEARGGEHAPYVLFAAALHPRKNLPVLRDAMASLIRGGAPHALVIAGGAATDRADSSQLERAARAELPGTTRRVVRVADPTDADMAALMAGADVFCLPSLYEGFGMTALEAMASGTPVIVSDRGALPEVVGDAGLIVSPDANSVERALCRVLSEAGLAADLRRKGLERARTHTWDRTAQGWLVALRQAANHE